LKFEWDEKGIFELPNFEYTPQGFGELKTALKAWKIVRNPFAKFYIDGVKVTVNQDEDSNADRALSGKVERTA
jgi:hypothetical protein